MYTGAISDKEITRCSGVLDLLERNDSVMANKGFDIEDLRKGVCWSEFPTIPLQ